MTFSYTLRAAAAAIATMASASAFAIDTPACSSWQSAATAYDSCTGFFSGNNSLANANAQGFGTFAFEAKDNQTGAGSDTAIFDVAGTAASLTLTFNQSIVGEFVVSLKLGNYSAYYDFDTAGIGAGETLTFTGSLPSYQALGLSHASVYYNQVTAVPEPETYALMLAGLGVVGFMARRRRQQA